MIEHKAAALLDLAAMPDSPGFAAGERAMPAIPEVTVSRLPVYYRLLLRLDDEGRSVVSSREIGGQLGTTAAQVRRDFSYLGKFGKQGHGYSVPSLVRVLRAILGLEGRWRMVLVGIGRLGNAIASYRGFSPQGFDIVGLYDTDAAVVGKVTHGHRVRSVACLESDLRADPPEIGIVAVPAAAAQRVTDALVGAGIRAILNYAPLAVRVPPGVQLRQIDPVISLHSITYHLRADRDPRLLLATAAAVDLPPDN